VQRLAHIVMQAELEAVICSGPLEGKQFTYALLEERVPSAKTLDRDEALAVLAKRYFQSHGPAQVIDFAWWSGLPMTDVKKGVEMAQLQHEVVEEKTYYFFESNQIPKVPEICYLLPNYDEYTIAYKDRTAFFNPEHFKHLDSRGNSVFQNVIIYKGKITGLWKRTFKKDLVILETKFFGKPSTKEQDVFTEAVNRFSEFLQLPVHVSSS
jgi:hypothetical protein